MLFGPLVDRRRGEGRRSQHEEGKLFPPPLSRLYGDSFPLYPLLLLPSLLEPFPLCVPRVPFTLAPLSLIARATATTP